MPQFLCIGMHTIYTNEFPSTLEAVGQVLAEALDVLIRHDWCPQGNCFSVRLCIEEALVNAVRHGNKGVAEHRVCLEIREDGERCRIRVRDQGEGFDPNSISMPDCEEFGGRGVCLIKHFMDDVSFDRESNCLEMVFRKGGCCSGNPTE